MAFRAEGDEIVDFIVSQLAACLSMMYLEILHPSTLLAAPCVAFEDPFPKLAVFIRRQLQPRPMPGVSIQRFSSLR